ASGEPRQSQTRVGSPLTAHSSLLNPNRQQVAAVPAQLPGMRRQQRVESLRLFPLQHQYRFRSHLFLQISDQQLQLIQAPLVIRKWWADENVYRLCWRRPTFGPTVNVGPHNMCLPGDAKGAQMAFDLPCQALIAFDKQYLGSPPAQRFQTDGTRTGKDIDEEPARHRIAQDAE